MRGGGHPVGDSCPPIFDAGQPPHDNLLQRGPARAPGAALASGPVKRQRWCILRASESGSDRHRAQRMEKGECLARDQCREIGTGRINGDIAPRNDGERPSTGGFTPRRSGSQGGQGRGILLRPPPKRPVRCHPDFGIGYGPARAVLIHEYHPHQVALRTIVQEKMSQSRPAGSCHR